MEFLLLLVLVLILLVLLMMCEGLQLLVKVIGDIKKFYVGDIEIFIVEVSSLISCYWDIQKVKQIFIVMFGLDCIWLIDDCGFWGLKGVYEIKFKNFWIYKILWLMKCFMGKCKLFQEFLGVGYYVVIVNFGGGFSGCFVMWMGI